MKTVLIIGILSQLLMACNAGTEKAPKQVAEAAKPPLTPSLAVYTDTLNKLDINKQDAIEQAVQLYDIVAPHDSTGADSAASSLMQFIGNIVKKENDSLLKNTADLFPLLNPVNHSLTDRQKAVKSTLHARRLKLVRDGEGGIYAVPSHETILPTVKARTSAPVDNYLDLVAKEDTTPVFLDAGLALETTELVDRLALSEQLMDQPLPGQFAAEAARLNRFYTIALLTGSDNTPSLVSEAGMLNEAFQKGYDYLLAKYPSTKAAAKVNVWLAVVASGDKKKIDAFRSTIQ